jgi:hypothetical protein
MSRLLSYITTRYLFLFSRRGLIAICEGGGTANATMVELC